MTEYFLESDRPREGEHLVYPLEDIIACVDQDKLLTYDNVKFELGASYRHAQEKLYELVLIGVPGIPKNFIKFQYTESQGMKLIVPDLERLEGWKEFIEDSDVIRKIGVFFELDLVDMYLPNLVTVASIERVLNGCLFVTSQGTKFIYARWFSVQDIKFDVIPFLTKHSLIPEGTQINMIPSRRKEFGGCIFEFSRPLSFPQYGVEDFKQINNFIYKLSKVCKVEGLTWGSFVYEKYSRPFSPAIKLALFESIEEDSNPISFNERVAYHTNMVIHSIPNLDDKPELAAYIRSLMK